MIQYRLNEDKYLSKLSVRFSYKLFKEIKEIENYNQNNPQTLSLWLEYLNEAKNYISNRAIAWNYNRRNIKFPNGTFFIKDFDYNIGYTIKTNIETNGAYVYIFMMNLKLEEFGLKAPIALKENKSTIILKESQLHFIIREAIKKIMLIT